MSLSNLQQKLKKQKMPIVQIVIASLLFVAISDKAVFSNIFGYFQNMHLNSPENVITGILNISRLVSIQYSIALGIGYMFIEIAKFVAIAIAVLAIIKFVFSFDKVEQKKYEIISDVDFIQTNDLYLKTSKFIC